MLSFSRCLLLTLTVLALSNGSAFGSGSKSTSSSVDQPGFIDPFLEDLYNVLHADPDSPADPRSNIRSALEQLGKAIEADAQKVAAFFRLDSSN